MVPQRRSVCRKRTSSRSSRTFLPLQDQGPDQHGHGPTGLADAGLKHPMERGLIDQRQQALLDSQFGDLRNIRTAEVRRRGLRRATANCALARRPLRAGQCSFLRVVCALKRCEIEAGRLDATWTPGAYRGSCREDAVSNVGCAVYAVPNARIPQKRGVGAYS